MMVTPARDRAQLDGFYETQEMRFYELLILRWIFEYLDLFFWNNFMKNIEAETGTKL